MPIFSKNVMNITLLTLMQLMLFIHGSTLYLLNLCSKRHRDEIGGKFEDSSEEDESMCCSSGTDNDDDEGDDNAEDDWYDVHYEDEKDYKRGNSKSDCECDIFHSQFTYFARIGAGQALKHEKAEKKTRSIQKSVGSKEKVNQSKSKQSKVTSKQDDKGLVKEQTNAAQKEEKGKGKRPHVESKDRKKEQKQDKQKKSPVQKKGKPKETKHKAHEQKKGGESVEKPKQKKSTAKSKILPPKGKQRVKRSGEGVDKKKSVSMSSNCSISRPCDQFPTKIHNTKPNLINTTLIQSILMKNDGLESLLKAVLKLISEGRKSSNARARIKFSI
ncbi:hypothetical protein Y032_0150g2747 [Ancylostoma ceylanicum]|uniref:Uncharacterized protein n=1 Tax=Ancylostoma ceylanicum TaxID=53326 RepID=A0A016T1B6_9BILA|nr:hypothetical protein Y032_0150g2747 [Ancylostoma ceylanicum]